MNKLAVFSPNLGAVSESFIKRHMEELLPHRSVIVAGSDQKPYCGHWDVEALKYLLPELKGELELDRRAKALRMALRAVGLRHGANLLHHRGLRDFLTGHRVSVVLGEYLDVSTTILDLAEKLGISVFAHAHGYDISLKLREGFWRREYRRLNRAAGVITMSRHSKGLLVEAGIREELIHVIPYGVSLPEAAAEKSGGASVRCLAVGRMVPKKAPLLLLEAFRGAAAGNPRLTLDFVGTGSLFGTVSDYVAAHGLEGKVTLHGALPNEEVQRLLGEADIFVQHSVTCPVTGDQEGLPVSILEAMAHGLPVVSTRHAGIPEAVSEGVSGLLVEENDAASMAERILLLSGDKGMREAMGREGRRIVERRYTWETEKRSLLALIEACL